MGNTSVRPGLPEGMLHKLEDVDVDFLQQHTQIPFAHRLSRVEVEPLVLFDDLLQQDVKNGGSETGATLVRLKLFYSDKGSGHKRRTASVVYKAFGEDQDKAKKTSGNLLVRRMSTFAEADVEQELMPPDTLIGKLSDIVQVPQAALINVRLFPRRLLVFSFFAAKDPKFRLWEIPIKLIRSEIECYNARNLSPTLQSLMPRLYYSRSCTPAWPTVSSWVWRGRKAVKTTRTILFMEEMTDMISAKGTTGICDVTHGVTTEMVGVAVRGLARLHATHWMNFEGSPMVAWQRELSHKKKLNLDATFWYVMNFGCRPDGVEIPNPALLMFSGDKSFPRLKLREFITSMKHVFPEFNDPNTLRALDILQRSYFKFIAESSKCGPEDCQTILHGDAHPWNMFWSNPPVAIDADEQKKDNRFVMVDWQCTGVGRVVWELHYFLRNIPFDSKLFAYYLDEYHAALCKFSSRPIEEEYPRATFIRDYHLIVLRRSVHYFMEVVGMFTVGRMKFAKTVHGLERGKEDLENAKELVRYRTSMKHLILELIDSLDVHHEELKGYVVN